MAALTSLRRIVAGSGDLPTGVVLSGVSAYAWMLSKRAQGIEEVKPAGAGGASSLRSRIANSGIARREVGLRMRDGALMRCPLVDSGGVLSVYADRDYDIPGVDWPNVRSIVDVGAHIGSFTVWAARRAPEARCIAVEPNPRTFAVLKSNLEANRLAGRVTAINAAIGPRPAMGSLELVDHSLGTRLARGGQGEVPVEIVTLDSALGAGGIERVDVLKIDCEGTEYEVFGAMSAQRLASIDAIGCEYHPEPGHDVGELDAILQGAGFRVRHAATPLGVLWATRPAQVTV